MIRVALFTHFFLESTHYAIRRLVESLEDVRFRVFARRFRVPPEGVKNVELCQYFAKGGLDARDLEGCDLVHAIYDGDTAFDAALLASQARLPFMVSFHGGFDTNSKIFDERYRSATADLAQAAAIVTVVSRMDVDRLASVGVRERVTILPVPIEHGILPLSCVEDLYRLIVVGRLVPKKGIDTALSALALLPSRYRLAIVGDGPLQEELRSLSSRLQVDDRVEWLGELSQGEMLSALGQCSILLHPARVDTDGNAEGTPQVILWAQALGVPVISTPTGSIPEIVSAGTSGLLVSPDDPEGLAAAIEGLNRDDFQRSRIIDQAKRSVGSRSLARVSEVLANIYHRAQRTPPLDHPLIRPLRSYQGYQGDLESVLMTAANAWDLKLETLEFVASGGEGIVFLVRNSANQRLSVKTPAYEKRPIDEHWILEHKLLKEAEVLRASHSGILPRLVDVDPEGKFLLREFITGEPLSRTIKYLEPQMKVLILFAFLEMSRSLVHEFHEGERGCFLLRDLKLQNIVVPIEHPGALRLIDLGAVMPEKEVPARRWGTERLGSGQWLHWAPEQHLGQSELIDRRVDYFSIGVAGYTILVGRSPYTNKTSDPQQALESYQYEYKNVCRIFKETADNLGVDLESVKFILACLSPHRDGRPYQFDLSLGLAPTMTTADVFGSCN